MLENIRKTINVLCDRQNVKVSPLKIHTLAFTTYKYKLIPLHHSCDYVMHS